MKVSKNLDFRYYQIHVYSADSAPGNKQMALYTRYPKTSYNILQHPTTSYNYYH